MNRSVSVLFSLACALGAVEARAADVSATPADYLDKVAALGPGDTLHLASGEYTGCLELFGMHGTEGAPIVITGPETGPKPIFRGSPCTLPNNLRDSVVVFLKDASYITIRNLEIDCEDQIVSGVRAGFGTTPVHHIVVEGLYIHDNDVNNQPSGISSFATAWNWTIRNNVIEHTGLGMYLGDSDGTDPFIAATIEHNLILNPRGYGMQIKHQLPREAVAGMPQGDSVTYLRHNVFIKAENAATGDDARPNLLVGAFPPSGVGSNDRYEIYGNLFYENQSDSEPLFQGEGQVSFHDNVLVNSYAGAGALFRPHNGMVLVADVFRNTVLTEGVGISITGAQVSQRVEGNVVYSNAMPGILGGATSENVQGTLLDAPAAIVDPTPTFGMLDAHPSSEAIVRGTALDWSGYADHADIELDFDGRNRDGTWRGAYAGPDDGSSWRLAAEIKPTPGTVVADGGVPGADATVRPDAQLVDSGDIGDAGDVAPLDAGVAPADGGAAADSGVPEGPVGVDGGCRCVATSSAGAAWLAVLFGLGLRRRRQRLVRAGSTSAE